MTSRLLKYAGDPDEIVRSIVFDSYEFGGGKYLGDFYLASDSEEAQNCRVVINSEGLAIELRNKVLFVRMTSLQHVVVTESSSAASGVFMLVDGRTTHDHYLLVPDEHWHHDTSESEAAELFLEISSIAHGQVGTPKLDGDEMRIAIELWNAVPDEFKNSVRA